MKKDLMYYLEEIQVQEIAADESDQHPAFLKGWFGVVNEQGICAYFGTETDALNFRLSYINRILNP